MKRYFLLTISALVLALNLIACSASNSETEYPPIDNSDVGNTIEITVQQPSSRIIKNLSIDDFMANGIFELYNIHFGDKKDEVLSALNITESDIIKANNPDDTFIDSVIYEYDGINFYPYIHFWNGEVTLVYLCADSSLYDASKIKDTLYNSFYAILGEPSQNTETVFWEKANTRLWIGQSIDFPNHGSCSAILIQKVTA